MERCWRARFHISLNLGNTGPFFIKPDVYCFLQQYLTDAVEFRGLWLTSYDCVAGCKFSQLPQGL